MRRRVLVLDADSAAGLETVQSLGRNGCAVHTASLRPEYSRHRSHFIESPFHFAGSEDGGIHELVHLFQTHNYDLVVPTTEVALLTMLEPEIPDDMYRRAVLPPRPSVQTALDKQAVWDLAQRLGVRVPSGDLVSLESPPPEIFPVVLKPVFSKLSTSGVVREFHVTIASDLNQWRSALASTYQGIPVQQQQYVTGKGFGVEMLFEHGAPRWAFLHERVHELPLTGGGSSYRVSHALRDDLVESATRLLAALDWHGVAMVEFKITAHGEAYLMEINPRLWGSLALAIDCGVNFPVGLLCLGTGQPLPPQPKYRVGYYTRNIYRDVEWFKKNLRADRSDPLLLTAPIASSALEWLRPLAGKESWDFFCWSDLGVILGELKTLAQEHWRRVANAVKRRSRRMYLRHIQQPHMLRKLKGQQIDKVLVLCHGNICRSPLAAIMAARRFPNASIVSAGFYPKTGRPSPGFVLAAAEQFGFQLAEHRSQCVNAQMIDDAQLILIMDIRNYESLRKEFPHALAKTVFLGMLLPKPQLVIKDPYDDPESMSAVASKMSRAVEQLDGLLH
jgi:protein-tyrosine-phosphatase/predicted ATP-grasp superfamily ATP-dependent carboligase